MPAKTPAITSPQTGEQILLVLQDVIETGLTTYTIGDIVLTDRNFYYFKYFQESNPWMMFGAVGGLVTAITDKKRYQDLRQKVIPYRAALKGQRLEDRIASKWLYPFLHFPVSAKTRLTSSRDDNLCLEKGKRIYVFFVPPMSAEILAALTAWPFIEPIYDSTQDPLGFFTGSVSPHKLLQRVANGDDSAAQEIYQLSLSRDYLPVIFSHIMMMVEPFRKKVLTGFEHAPQGFRKYIHIRAEAAHKKARSNILIAGVFIAVGLLLGINAISSGSFGTILLALLIIAASIWGIIYSNNQVKASTQIARFLPAGNNETVASQPQTTGE